MLGRRWERRSERDRVGVDADAQRPRVAVRPAPEARLQPQRQEHADHVAVDERIEPSTGSVVEVEDVVVGEAGVVHEGVAVADLAAVRRDRVDDPLCRRLLSSAARRRGRAAAGSGTSCVEQGRCVRHSTRASSTTPGTGRSAAGGRRRARRARRPAPGCRGAPGPAPRGAPRPARRTSCCAGSARRPGSPTQQPAGERREVGGDLRRLHLPRTPGVAGGLHLVAAGRHSRFPRKTRTGGANVVLREHGAVGGGVGRRVAETVARRRLLQHQPVVASRPRAGRRSRRRPAPASACR